jgi:hypothetical protein
MKTSLTKSLADSLLKFYYPAADKNEAVKRLKNLCLKHSINMHLLGYNFEEDTAQEVDSIYILTLTF